MEVAARAEAGALFEERPEEFLGRTRVHGGLQDHCGVRAQVCGQGAGGVGQLAQVERAVRATRGRRADDRGTDPAEFGRVGGRPEARREHPAQVGGGQRRGVATLVAECGDAGADGDLGQGQAELAETDDGEICGHGGGPSFPVTEGGQGRKPCGQNGRAQCQTRSKYDRFAGLLGCVLRKSPRDIHRRTAGGGRRRATG